MTPEESSIIRDVFARIRDMGPVPRDDAARAAVDAELRSNPDAGLSLVRALVLIEQECAQLAADRDQLAARLSAATRGNSGGGLFGPAVPPVPPRSVPQAGPWGQQQPPQQPWGQSAPPPMQPQSSPWGQPQAAQQPGGGFLRTALGAATGMAGGLFAFEALKGVFGGHTGGGLFPANTTETAATHDSNVTYNPYGPDTTSNQPSGGFFDSSSDDGASFGSGDDDSNFG